MRVESRRQVVHHLQTAHGQTGRGGCASSGEEARPPADVTGGQRQGDGREAANQHETDQQRLSRHSSHPRQAGAGSLATGRTAKEQRQEPVLMPNLGSARATRAGP